MYTQIIAILPEQVKGKGIYSRIYREDKTVLDRRNPALFLKNLYESKGKNKRQMDKKIKSSYQIYRNIPYSIDSNHVFFGFKIRNTDIIENNRAFINVRFIREIKGNLIILETGEEIETLNTEKSLINNRNLAKALLMEEILQKTMDRDNNLRYLIGNLRG